MSFGIKLNKLWVKFRYIIRLFKMELNCLFKLVILNCDKSFQEIIMFIYVVIDIFVYLGQRVFFVLKGFNRYLYRGLGFYRNFRIKFDI